MHRTQLRKKKRKNRPRFLSRISICLFLCLCAGMLFLRQFAFPHNALMLFVCALDAVFELPSVVRQLFGHFIGSPRHIASDCAQDVYGLANMELMRRHQTSLVQPARARPCGECFLRIIFLL
jgi:hypothetical protein